VPPADRAGPDLPPGPVDSQLAAAAIGAAVAGVTAASTLPFLGRYGWDRDELYFLAAARHPALGYVDFPPLVAWLGRAVVEIAGPSLDALRVTTMLIAVVSIVLVSMCARELGGGRAAQAGAAAAWGFCPFLLGSASIFHPTWLDLLCQVGVSYLALRVVLRPRPWVWPALGLVAGIGLEAKYTIGLLLVALLAAFALTPARRELRGRGVVVAAGLATLVFLPNLVWEVQHGWVSATFASSQRAKTAQDTPPATYVAEMIAFLGAAAPLAAVGAVHLWRRGALRAFTLTAALVAVGFAVEQGRAYYPLPALALCVAAGAVAIERWRPRGRASRPAALGALAVLLAGVLAVAAPLVVPVRTTAGMIQSGVWENSFFKDEIGWPEMTRQVARAWRSLPAGRRRGMVLLARNYGEAGALALYGPAMHLPQPLSGHLSWQYWRPASLPQRQALTVGFDRFDLDRLCARYRVLARIQMPFKLGNEEQGRPIAACSLRRPLGRLWSSEIVDSRL
jgi:Dolichyl-phosphate-mannose-protein mannosyltransferase